MRFMPDTDKSETQKSEKNKEICGEKEKIVQNYQILKDADLEISGRKVELTNKKRFDILTLTEVVWDETRVQVKVF